MSETLEKKENSKNHGGIFTILIPLGSLIQIRFIIY